VFVVLGEIKDRECSPGEMTFALMIIVCRNSRGCSAIVTRSYSTSEFLLPHPTNVLRVKHSRLAFRTFSLPRKIFSSLFDHPGKGRKLPCLPQFHFVPCLNLLNVFLPVPDLENVCSMGSRDSLVG
jgi:hypothetical protein